MLDIISIAILTFILVGLPLILIIIGGNKNKSEKEIEDELKEEEKFLIDYKRKTTKYNWEQVQAYTIIALNNLMHSANDISLKNIKMTVEPLDLIHTKNKVVEYSKKLLLDEEKNITKGK